MSSLATSTSHQHEDAHKQRFVETILRHLDVTMNDAPPGLPRVQYWDLLAAKVADLPRDLGEAVESGDIDDARGFLRQRGVDVDAYDENGATLTYVAAAHGHTAMVGLLVDEGGADISKGTPVDAGGNAGGRCPLYIAAKNGRADTVRALIERGADVNQATNDGATPVFVASQEGHTAALTLLLEKGGNANQAIHGGATPVLIATQNGHTAALKLLLENGGDANRATNDGCTPVIVASYEGQTAALKLLLENGGDAKQANNNGSTPVYIASAKGHAAAIKLLLKAGADVHKPTNEGVVPVWIAAQNGHTDALHTLLKAGANAQTAVYDDQPTLHIAAMKGHLPVVRVLAEIWPLDRRPWKMFLMGGGAASELQDYLVPPANRTTRNFLPRLYSKPDMVKEIWKYLHKPQYVDVGKLDGEGRTAVQVATTFGKHDVAALLQGLGV